MNVKDDAVETTSKIVHMKAGNIAMELESLWVINRPVRRHFRLLKSLLHFRLLKSEVTTRGYPRSACVTGSTSLLMASDQSKI